MTDLPDPIADIRALLAADTDIQTLVGQTAASDYRVFHSELPDTESGSMPRQAVVLAQAGGPGRAKRTNLRRIRLDTICYGATLYESQRLHDVVREVLEGLARTSSSVKTIEMSSEGQNGRDPLKQWPVCFATYTVLATTSV